MINSQFLKGNGGLAVGSALAVAVAVPVRIPFAEATSFSSRLQGLVSNGYCSKLKTRYTKVPDWIKITRILYEKTTGK